MGAGACCGEDRKIATIEKRKILEGKSDDSFKFKVNDTDIANSDDEIKTKKGKKSRVRFAEEDPSINEEI